MKLHPFTAAYREARVRQIVKEQLPYICPVCLRPATEPALDLYRTDLLQFICRECADEPALALYDAQRAGHQAPKPLGCYREAT